MHFPHPFAHSSNSSMLDRSSTSRPQLTSLIPHACTWGLFPGQFARHSQLLLHLSRGQQHAYLVSCLLAKQRSRHLAMAQGNGAPDCVLYRLGRSPFLLRRILSFECCEQDMARSCAEKYRGGWGGEEDETALGEARVEGSSRRLH